MIVGIEAEYQSDAESTKDTPYLALTGELWGVFCEYLWENWPHYILIPAFLELMKFPLLLVIFSGSGESLGLNQTTATLQTTFLGPFDK